MKSMLDADRKGGHIRTFSGRYVSVTAPRQEDLVLVDFAHSQSLINRYTGHSPVPFSDAQHAVLVSYLVPSQDALDGLFHDCTESIVGDINRPLKQQNFMCGYRENEQEVYRAIAQKFGLSFPLPQIVHVADMQAYYLECHRLFDEPLPEGLQATWDRHGAELTRPTSWQFAKEMFLERYWELRKGREF